MIPYDKRSGKIWYNTELVDWADAKIHVLNHGLHYASCVFEGERVYDGSIFKLEEHTSRLFYSAERMGMTIPYTEKKINDACNQIISVQKVENGAEDSSDDFSEDSEEEIVVDNSVEESKKVDDEKE